MRPLGTVMALAMAFPAPAQERDIAIIDFYGLRQVSEAEVRIALGFRPGDPAPTTEDEASILESLREISGVRDASLHLIQVEGRLILYVGIEEEGSEPLAFAAAPSGDARLPDQVVADYEGFLEALKKAVSRGRLAEDRSQGHSLVEDPGARAMQLKFVEDAAEHFDLLRDVLATSGDDRHREIAAMVLSYAADKKAVLPDLLAAVRDPSPGVRNNAVRALGVLATYAVGRPELQGKISLEPFVDMLRSLEWTDRNKALLVVYLVTGSGDPHNLELVREGAWDSLMEMARWQHEGHALLAFMVLARVVGLAEEEIFPKWKSEGRAAWLEEMDRAHRR